MRARPVTGKGGRHRVGLALQPDEAGARRQAVKIGMRQRRADLIRVAGRGAGAAGVGRPAGVPFDDRRLSRPLDQVIAGCLIAGRADQNNGAGIAKKGLPGILVQMLQHAEALHDNDDLDF